MLRLSLLTGPADGSACQSCRSIQYRRTPSALSDLPAYCTVFRPFHVPSERQGQDGPPGLRRRPRLPSITPRLPRLASPGQSDVFSRTLPDFTPTGRFSESHRLPNGRVHRPPRAPDADPRPCSMHGMPERQTRQTSRRRRPPRRHTGRADTARRLQRELCADVQGGGAPARA